MKRGAKRSQAAAGLIIVLIVFLVIVGVIYYVYNKNNEQLIGGCAGVSLQYLQECCNKWAIDNNVSVVECIGKWEIEDNKCSWKCGVEEEGKCIEEGEIGDVTKEQKCCEGLMTVGNALLINGECSFGKNTSFVCANASNNKCGLGENECNNPTECPDEFCGSSTHGVCNVDNDCKTSGCSGQICQNKTEDFGATTCEWRNCYDDEKYGYECSCLNNKCQWK